MLPDYPSVKQEASKVLNRFVHAETMRVSPVLAEVSRIRQHEGTQWGLDEKGAGGLRSYRKSESRFTLTRDEMKTGGFARIVEKYGSVAREFAEEQSRHMFEQISEAVESTGNVVKATGGLTQDKFLEALERFQTDFDRETGEPRGGSFVMHPDMAEKVLPLLKQWEDDPEFKQRLEQIREQQFLEWRARELNRRLAD